MTLSTTRKTHSPVSPPIFSVNSLTYMSHMCFTNALTNSHCRHVDNMTAWKRKWVHVYFAICFRYTKVPSQNGFYFLNMCIKMFKDSLWFPPQNQQKHKTQTLSKYSSFQMIFSGWNLVRIHLIKTQFCFILKTVKIIWIIHNVNVSFKHYDIWYLDTTFSHRNSLIGAYSK